MEATLTGALVLGLLLGARHSLDADHVVAVSTIVSEYRNPLRALWVGVSWGLGHTTTLFLLGLVVIAVGVVIPDQLALAFEFGVGIVLVLLGLQVLWNLWRRALHLHSHEHEEQAHAHLHVHDQSPAHAHPSAVDWRLDLMRPSFRRKSYLVGTVHGLAGSAALMLIVLSSIESPLWGLAYIVLFGLGSVASMGIITIFLGLPFSLSSRAPTINRIVQGAAGVASILFGAFLMYEIGVVEGLLV